MITFNNSKDTEIRSNVVPLSLEEMETLIKHLNSILPQYGAIISDNLQRLLDRHANLQHFYDNAGGWEGLAKLQETADSKGWISVDERLPEHNQEVLVINNSEYEHAIFRGKQFRVIRQSDSYKEVTHWQPLPSPPTE